MKKLVTKSLVAVLITAVLLASVSSGVVFAHETLWSGKALSTVGSPGATTTWDLPWGLDADPASVNIWTYPEDAVTVTLASVEGSMPAGLLIWYYGGPAEGWGFYKKGWGAVNTLTALVPGEGYVGIVPTASVWEIRQGAEASATIGPEGGTIEVTDPSSPLCGLKVEISEGALAESTVIEVDVESDPAPLSPEIVPVSVVVRLSPDGIKFNSPVKIRLTYNTESVETGDFVVPLIYSESDDYWYVPYIVDIDRNEGMVEIGTNHFSHIIVGIIDMLSGWENPSSYDTEFRPQLNGFPKDFENTGGWCEGMACFCQWLYENHPECNGISSLSRDDAQKIAESAQLLTSPGSKLWEWKTAHRARFAWDKFLYVSKREMAKSGLPTVIVRWSNVEGKKHALLAHRYDGDVIWYYDVNHPGQELQLTSAEYDQADIDYAVARPRELYSPTDFEELFDKYKDVLCPGETWCFTFYNRLPAVYLYAYPVEIYYVDEDYGPVMPVGMDIDFNEIPELAGLGQLWYAPVPEEPICIQVTREGDNIDASFEFTHEPTGYDVSAELSGTIIDSAVNFNISYYPPDGLRNYSMPLSYSDCMSDMAGTVYYSLPAVLTVNYQGTIIGGTIQGAFQTVIASQWARWRYHDQEYACRVVGDLIVREELLFDGIVEWTFSNLRLSGDFRVDIGS
ncbi:MAG: hypothetical protein WBH01_04560 [Dehalococcoidia bacterium]